MATLNLQVNSSTDDARSTSAGGSFNTTITTQYVGIKGGIDYYFGMRFTNVTLDQGETINEAILDIYNATIGEGTTVEIIIEGHDADDAATFSTGFKPNDITATTATVTDSVSVATFETAQGFGNVTWDVATIIQEIVDRPGWVSGNDIVLVMRDNGSSAANNISVSTYDRATDRGAKLTIDYGAAAPPPTPTKAWEAKIGAWIYPGSPADAAEEELVDGRRPYFINAEYLKIQSDGSIDQLNDPADGDNAYSAANAAEIKRHSVEQFVTLAGDGGAGDSTVLARTGTARQTDFDQIRTLVQTCGFTGVDVDIEGYGSWTTTKRDNFYTWLTALATEFHKYNLKVNVDMPPLWTKPNDGSAWDFDVLSLINVRYDAVEAAGVDYMTIMCYDHQYDVGVDGGVTNAVAPEGWITVVDTYVRSQVTDESKLVMGMNSYGYTANESAPYTITIQTKAQTDAAIDLSLGTRDTGSNEMFYETGGNQHYVWSDETTMNAKRAFIEDLGYDRICVWHLGGNDWFTGKGDGIGRQTPLPGFRISG